MKWITMWGWLINKQKLDLQVDIHSHLLPGLDDGVKTIDESLEILKTFSSWGFRKVISTPHIYADYYPNSEEEIRSKGAELYAKLAAENIQIDFEVAAEYYIDQSLIDRLKSQKPLLTFGDSYVLVETSFLSKPMIFEEAIFELITAGYRPVLAHPERYQYVTADWLIELKKQGVIHHLSLPSLVGAYGPKPKKIANYLLRHALYDMVGSDIHRKHQLEPLKKALNTRVPTVELINNRL